MNLTKKNIQKTSGIHTDGTLFIPSVSGKSYTKINNV